MELSDYLTSLARTAASKIVGGLIGVALALGIVVPATLSDELTLTVTAALMVGSQYAYYVAARWLEKRWPTIGRLMLWSGRTPTYGVKIPVDVVPVLDHDKMIRELEIARERIGQATIARERRGM